MNLYQRMGMRLTNVLVVVEVNYTIVSTIQKVWVKERNVWVHPFLSIILTRGERAKIT